MEGIHGVAYEIVLLQCQVLESHRGYALQGCEFIIAISSADGSLTTLMIPFVQQHEG